MTAVAREGGPSPVNIRVMRLGDGGAVDVEHTARRICAAGGARFLEARDVWRTSAASSGARAAESSPVSLRGMRVGADRRLGRPGSGLPLLLSQIRPCRATV